MGESIMKQRRVFLVSLTWVMLIAPALQADVKTERKTKLELPGVLGGFMNVFGGKGARDGTISKIALKGDRKMSVDDDRGEIIDLGQEKVYQLDMKSKSYTVRTFEEMRRQMQEAM